MRIAFFGTPEFAAVTLQRLIESRHEVVCVVTQSDKPTGRGRKIAPPPVKVLAEQHGLTVLQPESVKRPPFAEILKPFAPDIGIVVAYGKILPKDLLDVPKHGFLNIHGSLLPRYRGAAPIQWAIVRGERQTGVTIMRVTEGLDSGPIVAARAMDILDDDDARSVYDGLSVLGADLLMSVLDELEVRGMLAFTEQDHAEATHAPLIQRIDARIDWNKRADEIICQVRGFVLWPGAYTRTELGEVKIMGMEAASDEWTSASWEGDDVEPGSIVDAAKGRGLLVKTGDKRLVLITRVKFEGKREMDADAAVNGGLLAPGMMFQS